eukprot:g19199.t1
MRFLAGCVLGFASGMSATMISFRFSPISNLKGFIVPTTATAAESEPEPLDADPAYHAADEGGADNEDDVGPFDCPEGLTNITTLIKRSGPLPNMFQLSFPSVAAWIQSLYFAWFIELPPGTRGGCMYFTLTMA